MKHQCILSKRHTMRKVKFVCLRAVFKAFSSGFKGRLQLLKSAGSVPVKKGCIFQIEYWFTRIFGVVIIGSLRYFQIFRRLACVSGNTLSLLWAGRGARF